MKLPWRALWGFRFAGPRGFPNEITLTDDVLQRHAPLEFVLQEAYCTSGQRCGGLQVGVLEELSLDIPKEGREARNHLSSWVSAACCSHRVLNCLCQCDYRRPFVAFSSRRVWLVHDEVFCASLRAAATWRALPSTLPPQTQSCLMERRRDVARDGHAHIVSWNCHTGQVRRTFVTESRM